MNMQEQVIKICCESLGKGQADIDPFVSALFFDPSRYGFLKRVIIHPPVAFMYCIHIRKCLTKECEYSNLSKITSGDRNGGPQYSLQDIVQIAESTQFAQKLQNIIGRSFSHESRSEGGLDEATAKKKKKTGLPKDTSNHSELWYESLIFINLLIHSKQYSGIPIGGQLSQTDILPSLAKFRMEMLAKLLINVLTELGSDSITCEAFEDILKTMVDLSGREQILSIEEMLMMIEQLMKYIKQEEQIRISKRFTKLFGKYMMKMLMGSLKRLLHCQSHIPKVIEKAFNAIDEYITLISILKNKRKPLGILKNSDQNDDESDQTQSRVYNSEIFLNFHFDFVRNAIAFIDMRDRIVFDDSFQRCLEIMEKITLVSYLAGQDNNVRQQICNSFQANVSIFMTKIMVNWFNCENIRQDNNQQYYFEAIAINILGNIFNNCIIFPHEHLLMTSLTFCHQIVQNIPIKVSLGDRSIMSIMFYYLRDVLSISKRLEDDTQIIFQLRRITQQFILLCSASQYDNIHLSMQEDVEACEMFFDPIIQLMQKLYLSQNRLLPDNHFTTIKKYARHLDPSSSPPQKTSILEILMIELVKNIESFENSQSYKTKCTLTFNLLKHYEDSQHIPHLMLLSAMADQIISEDSTQIGAHSIYFWFYIDKFTDYTVDSIMEMISSEVVAYLIKGNSLYLGKYAIHILNGLCAQLKQIQIKKGNKQGSLIKKYLSPVVNYVNNLNLTVLKSIDSYQQRQRLLELICQIGVATIQDVYDIYAAIRPKFDSISQEQALKLIIDMTGLLSFNSNQDMEEVFLQLTFNDLKGNKIIDLFTLTTLEDQLYFDIYTQFLLKVLQKLEKVTRFKKEDSLTTDFEIILYAKLDVLSGVYSQGNFAVIHQIWEAFISLDKMNLVFPKIPDIIYSDKVIFDVVDWMFKHLTRFLSIESVKTLYCNTFQRKRLQPQEAMDEQLMKPLANQSNFPQYLFLLADYLDFSGQRLFFQYENAIEAEIIKMYGDISVSSKSYDYFGIDSDSQEEETDLVKVLQLPDKSEHKKKMNYLMKAAYIFDFVSSRAERTFANFRESFIGKLKAVNDRCKAM